MFYLFFFFFKQKTAYEMRISDWSSDVCSSDLHAVHLLHAISGVSAAHLHHVAVAACHLRGIGHPDAPLSRSRGTRAILRNRLPLIVAGLLAVVWLAGECGDRCGKGYAQQGIENTVFHACSPWAIIVDWPQVRQDFPIRDGRTDPERKSPRLHSSH